jgi:hypothetical protein
LDVLAANGKDLRKLPLIAHSSIGEREGWLASDIDPYGNSVAFAAYPSGDFRLARFRDLTLRQLFVERQGQQRLQKRVEAGHGERADDQHEQDSAPVGVERHPASDERDDDQPDRQG